VRAAAHASVLGIALLFASSMVRAQVNVEPLRQQVAQRGVGARLRASATTLAGNTSGVIFGSSALAGFHSQRNVAYLVLTGDYTRLNGVVSVAKWFAHARHNYELRRWLWWEEYAQLESDRFRRVNVRKLVGTGPRLGIIQSEPVELFYGISYLYEQTTFETADREPSGEGSAHRLSNYLALTLRVHERISLSSVTYIQPRFDEPLDLRVLSVSGADFHVTPLLHSLVDVSVRYDSETPSDVRGEDVELKSTLELVF
jgi:hypothetical protein